MARKKVTVVVLGDLGRSPRMLYHAQSLAKENFEVHLVGFAGSTLPKAIGDSNNITVHYLAPCPDFRSYLPLLIAYPIKVLWQSFVLFLSLLLIGRTSFVLVQNPPCIPTMPVCWFFCRLMQSCFIIDWHNYAYTILALSLGQQHKLVKISKWTEEYFGRKADANLCVTKAMKEDLAEKWGIIATVLHDRPNDAFNLISDEGKSDRFSVRSMLRDKYMDLAKLKEKLPVLVSSTSWTPDEDFSILLQALQAYDEDGPSEMLCVITGKGPEKDYYKEQIRNRQWKKVSIVTPWLDAEDYPLLLGVADLGVCLHASSSGLDLPMKVVDMFGCGLPVCALDFKCLGELVRHGENGFVFKNSSDLHRQILNWFRNFPSLHQDNQLIKDNVKTFRKTMWHANWCSNAKPLFS
ncbi:unnamed protein product [Bemisia tabaci]|uniref:Beta-1,4-mannosyltransferase n=1 Tax=Bemisia tabaci TaxID=7038 RepID=A0A9P0FAD6_BEMTA|nr:unnamed protein product [Bemisia tabaci]